MDKWLPYKRFLVYSHTHCSPGSLQHFKGKGDRVKRMPLMNSNGKKVCHRLREQAWYTAVSSPENFWQAPLKRFSTPTRCSLVMPGDRPNPWMLRPTRMLKNHFKCDERWLAFDAGLPGPKNLDSQIRAEISSN